MDIKYAQFGDMWHNNKRCNIDFLGISEGKKEEGDWISSIEETIVETIKFVERHKPTDLESCAILKQNFKYYTCEN